ncbi:MAG: hypothetical protein J5517_07220 [Eubacterium sp.]|nr:hypothetical protein [Eubacterium sp.]
MDNWIIREAMNFLIILSVILFVYLLTDALFRKKTINGKDISQKDKILMWITVMNILISVILSFVVIRPFNIYVFVISSVYCIIYLLAISFYIIIKYAK